MNYAIVKVLVLLSSLEERNVSHDGDVLHIRTFQHP